MALVRIAVIGGTGFIGARLVHNLEAGGHEVGAHGRSTGLDLVTGERLSEALSEVDVVVNTIDAPSFDATAATFFQTTTENLLAAAARARVKHIVLLSIVGIDRVSGVEYYKAKLLQEKLIQAGPTPYSIVRATQFMDFIAAIMSWTTEGDVVRLPTTTLQPVAAADLVDVLAEVATDRPRNGIVNVAGPDIVSLDELGRQALQAHPDARTVVVDESAGLFSAVSGDAIIAPPDARLAPTSYSDFLAN